MTYLGIDPGKSGAAVLISHGQHVLDSIRFAKATEKDIAEWFSTIVIGTYIRARIERVNAMPKQGVSSTFKFGTSYGFLRGMLAAYRIPFEAVTPGTWQRTLGCLSKGDKNVTKAKAQELFPQQKWTHADADAALIAEYCRRISR